MLGNPKPIREIRRGLCPRSGEGPRNRRGSGVNFHSLRPGAGRQGLRALNPNPGMRRLAEEQRRRINLEIEFLSLPGRTHPLWGT